MKAPTWFCSTRTSASRTTTIGWTYNESERSVEFDESHVPDGGSTIEVEYTIAGDCEG